MLYIVATPIGNLKDISQRALEVLASVDVIAAEDTRNSRHLLQAYSIKTPLLAYHDFSTEKQVLSLLQRLRDGQQVALISDAGTPLIADPGYRLVQLARQENIEVSPIPGASAIIAALSASGLPCDRFVFEGFLPSKQQARLKHLQALRDQERTMVFYEAPRRLPESLADMIEVFSPSRRVALAREISKRFETFKLSELGVLLSWVESSSQQLKGEAVLIVEGRSKRQSAALIDTDVQKTAMLLAQELPPRKAASLAAQLTGANKRAVYQLLIDSKS